jgi:hypothetical protein
MTAPALPTSYLLIGPPDLLHDLMLDFQEIGWECTVHRWQAVITAPADEAAHRAPAWPAEITLAGVSRTGHGAACQGHFTQAGV